MCQYVTLGEYEQVTKIEMVAIKGGLDSPALSSQHDITSQKASSFPGPCGRGREKALGTRMARRCLEFSRYGHLVCISIQLTTVSAERNEVCVYYSSIERQFQMDRSAGF